MVAASYVFHPTKLTPFHVIAVWTREFALRCELSHKESTGLKIEATTPLVRLHAVTELTDGELALIVAALCQQDSARETGGATNYDLWRALNTYCADNNVHVPDWD